MVETEAGVDALEQDPARLRLTVDDEVELRAPVEIEDLHA